MDIRTVIFVAIFLGVFVRTIAPYIRKRKKAERERTVFEWNSEYVITAAITIVIAFIVTAMAYPTFTLDYIDPYDAFLKAFVFGFALNSLVNEVSDWFIGESIQN